MEPWKERVFDIVVLGGFLVMIVWTVAAFASCMLLDPRPL
jgi:hypothetical protein